MENILVAVDLKEGTEYVLKHAIKQSMLYNAKLWIINVVEPEPDFVGYEVGPQYIRDTKAKELKTDHVKMANFAKQARLNGLNAESLMINGATIQMLIEEIEKLHVDMVIIGHHKHGMLHKLIFGNTDFSLIEKASTPVMVVPLK